MGAELMHSQWEILPLALACLDVPLRMPLFASHPLLVCVPTSLTCIHREPQHTPSTASILPHRIASRRFVASQPLPKARAPRRLAPRNAGTGAT